MKLPKDFEYYLGKKIIKKSFVNKSRAEFLVNGAQISFEGLLERVKMMGIGEKNAVSIIKDCYDIIMEMVRARIFLEGYSSSGNYSHEAEISFLRKMDFSNYEISFLNELRYFRNAAVYYGKLLDKEYAEKVFDFLERVYDRLKKMVGDKLNEVKNGGK